MLDRADLQEFHPATRMVWLCLEGFVQSTRSLEVRWGSQGVRTWATNVFKYELSPSVIRTSMRTLEKAGWLRRSTSYWRGSNGYTAVSKCTLNAAKVQDPDRRSGSITNTKYAETGVGGCASDASLFVAKEGAVNNLDDLWDRLDTQPGLDQPSTPAPDWLRIDRDRVRTIGYHSQHAGCVQESMDDAQRLNLALFEYEQALRRHGYGAGFIGPLGRHPHASKFAPRILQALEAMREEGVPPGIWIDWLVAYNRAQNHNKPIPIYVAFTPGLFKKRKAWFLKERAADFARDPIPHPADARVTLEQLFRNQENQQAWRRGRLPQLEDFASWHGGEFAWYAEMREREIRNGQQDPIANYPTLPVRYMNLRVKASQA